MAHKQVLFHSAAREKVLRGATLLADAVRVTLGPKSKSVLIQKNWGAPIVCNDGVTIAKEFDLKDAEENLGAQVLRQAAEKTGDVVGDGTSTSTILAHAMLADGVRNVVAGASAIDLKRGLDRGARAAIDALRAMSRPVKTKAEKAQVATISAHNDAAVGALVADAIEKVGGEGVISVEESKTTETILDVVEGMKFDRGFLSPYFVTDAERMEVVLEDALVLLCDHKIGTLRDLVPVNDEVIELGMVKFDYLPDGRIAGIKDSFSSFNEPTGTIPLEVTALTGITDEMVAGHRIDEGAVSAFVDEAVIVIAHNANFDRKFAERYWPIFERKAWGCSATEVEWRRHGFEGSRLGYLLNGTGYFHQAHRAVDDCYALLEILAFELPAVGSPALTVLLQQARRKTIRVWAEQSPFDLKDTLKRRGYRWSDGSDGRPRSWYVDVDESKLTEEIAFLKTEIYLRDVEPHSQTLTAFDRFSVRA